MNPPKPHLQINDILSMPDEDLFKLSDKELEELLKPLIPYARVPNKNVRVDAINDMIAKLERMTGV